MIIGLAAALPLADDLRATCIEGVHVIFNCMAVGLVTAILVDANKILCADRVIVIRMIQQVLSKKKDSSFCAVLIHM